jgi:hypothetical protein
LHTNRDRLAVVIRAHARRVPARSRPDSAPRSTVSTFITVHASRTPMARGSELVALDLAARPEGR